MTSRKKIKVFHGLVNYGTQAGLLAKELRNQGIEALSVVYPDKAKRKIDVELLHGGNFLEKIFKHLWNIIRKFYWFYKFNTFHFYFGKTLFRNQIDLPFYKLFGKKVIMEYLGNDIRNYRFLVSRYNLPKNHDFYLKMKNHDTKVLKRINHERKYIDFSLCCLPKYKYFATLYNYNINEILPLAIDLEKIPFVGMKNQLKNIPINILHAPTKRGFKGTFYVEKAIRKLQNEGFPVNLNIVEGITHAQLFKEYENCDIFIDQISTGWYGTAALEAMAFGKPTCAFYDDLYFQYINYSDEIPVINITRENVTDELRNLIENRGKLPEIGRKSREFVEKYHDVKNVTKTLIDIYQNKVWKQ